MKTSNQELSNLFFSELKNYNSTNFRTIAKADLSIEDATVHKSFSSVVTRFFLFSEKHPEIPETEKRKLFFKLKIDLIGKYFSQYPEIDTNLLRGFQTELQSYIESHKHGKREIPNESKSTTSEIQNNRLASAV